MFLPAVTSQFVIQNVVNAASLGCLYAVLALGLALLFGVMGLLNWAYGDLITVGAYTIVVTAGLAQPLVIVIATVVVVLVALAMERVAFRPVRTAPAETMLITSFGVSFFLQNLALLIFGQTPRTATVPTSLIQPFTVGSISIPRLDIVIIVVGGALLVALSLLLSRSRMGIQLRAAAEDFQMAQLLGVKANRVIAIAFAISGVLATVTAYFYVAQTGVVTPTFGSGPVLIAFTAVIVGGMGSVLGGVVGGFIIGVVSVALQAALPASLQPFHDAFLFGVVFAVLVFRPQGIIVPKTIVTRI